MPTQFALDLKQFALSVDIVDSQTLHDVGQLLKGYFSNTVKAAMFDVRVNAPSGMDGQRFLKTLWSLDGQEYTTLLHHDNGDIRGHTSYAVIHDKSLWVVAGDSEKLVDAKDYCDLWSGAKDLPEYRGWGDCHFATSIIVPIGRPAIGFINVEFSERLELCQGAKDELIQIADVIAIFWDLYNSHRARAKNTKSAMENLKSIITSNPLLMPKLFFAFPESGDQEVIGVIKDVLSEYRKWVDIISWDKIKDPGNAVVQIKGIIRAASFGICYFSQPGREKGTFEDNPNVVFEAGMFEAIAAKSGQGSRWLPIREKNSGPIPFNFSTDRSVIVPRPDGQSLNVQAFRGEVKESLDAMIRLS